MAEDPGRMVKGLFLKAFNEGDFSAAEENVAQHLVDHSTFAAPAPGGEGFRQRIAQLREAFPDCRFKIEEMLEEGELVAFTWRFTGSNDGPFMGHKATGKRVKITGINVERVRRGKIVEHWSSPDTLALFRQLGMIPGAGS